MEQPALRSDVWIASTTRFPADSAVGLNATPAQPDEGGNPAPGLMPGVLRLRDFSRRVVDHAGPALGLAAAYYVSCLVGFALRYPSSGISFLWPPNAVLLTGLLIVGPRRWAPLIAGALIAHGFAHTQDAIPAAAWAIQYFANASQALLAAWMMRRFGTVAIHDSFQGLLVFLIGACFVAPAVASVTSAYIYVALGWANDVFGAWRARTVSNAVATLSLVPSLLALWRYRVRRPDLDRRKVVEFMFLLLGLAVTHRVASAAARGDLFGLSVVLSATTPFLIWSTVRFDGAGLSFALSAAVVMLSTTAAHMRPVGATPAADEIIAVQLLLMATAVPLSLVAGLLQQRRTEHRALVDVEQRNRAILRALPDTTVLHTTAGTVLQSYPRRIDVSATGGSRAVESLAAKAIATAVAIPLEADGEEPRVTEYTEESDDAARRYEARSVAVDRERTVTIIRDITDRWQSQQALLEAQRRYTLALTTGGIGVWDYDVATGHFHIEGTLKRALGYGEDEIPDTLSDWQTIIFEPDRDDVLGRLSAPATDAAHSLETEFRVTHKNGSLRWISSSGAVTHLCDGKPSRIVGVYSDITERKEAGRALTEANDTLARLGRIAALSELTASLGHELNQPLAAISANVTACLRQLDAQRPAAIADALRDVLQDSQRASKIIERTHRLFDNRPNQPGPLNLNEVVREVVRIAAPRLRELHVRVRQALDPAIPNVHADDIQIQQVLFNLVVNAADALRAVDLNDRVIRISTRHTSRHVMVSVRDSGVGLDLADLARIFEPFYTTKPSGTGMGLAISRSIVRRHGGTLWAVANRSGGSTFRFKLPVRRSHPTSDAHRTTKVAVVDDHRGLRKSLTRLLRSYGHRVAVAASGTRALALAETFRPDAMVIDIALGDMTGLELAKRLRSVFANRPLFLIVLTAYDDEELRRACLADAFDAYLVKPTQVSELPELLQRRAH